MKHKVNGWPILVLDGREISESKFDSLSDAEKSRVLKRTNGPHHNAKWAKDLKRKEATK